MAPGLFDDEIINVNSQIHYTGFEPYMIAVARVTVLETAAPPNFICLSVCVYGLFHHIKAHSVHEQTDKQTHTQRQIKFRGATVFQTVAIKR